MADVLFPIMLAKATAAVVVMGLIGIAFPLVIYGVESSGERPGIAALIVGAGIAIAMLSAFPILFIIGI